MILWLLADATAVLVRLRRWLLLSVAALVTLVVTQVDLVPMLGPALPTHYYYRVKPPLTRQALAMAYLEELPRMSLDTWLERSTQTYDMARYHNNFDAAAGLWLRDRYGPQTRIVSIQAGQFAYWCEMPFFDMFGLVTPAVTRLGGFDTDALSRLIAAFDPKLIAFYKHSGGVHHRTLALDGVLWEEGYGLRYVIQRGRLRAFVIFEKGYKSDEVPQEVLFASMEDLPRRVNRDRWIACIDPNNDHF
jgi:hypothetical protein